MVKGGHPMIGASKILTVSYGTFSCTLEGFDDPFNTMRAIAEYFRDLAAEDRYFGAEPPTPDAAMLLKIAEREVQRRVEAKIQDNGVVLRTGDAMQAPRPMPAPQPQSPVAHTPVAHEPVPVSRPRAEPALTPMPEGVAAKLLRIRAAVINAELAVTRDATPTAFAPTDPILTDYSEDQHADEFTSADSFAATFEDQDFAAGPIDTDVWDQPDAALTEPDRIEGHTDLPINLRAEPEAAVAAAAEPEIAPAADPDADADFASLDLDANDAMLGRIADATDAPIQHPEPEMLPEEVVPSLAEYTADPAPAQPTPDAAFAPAPDARTDLSPLAPAPSDADVAAPTDFAIADSAGDTFDDAMADADYVISPEDLADLNALDAAPISALDAAPVEEASPDTSASEASLYDEDYDAPLDSSVAATEDAFADDADMAEQTVEDPVDPVLEEIDSAYEPQDEPLRGPSEKALRARARVLKVRRDDVTTADISAAEASPDVSSDIVAMMAADAQDALRRDLHALQLSLDTPNPNDVHDEAGSEDDARKRLDAAGEEAVARLLEQTNEAMAVPENRRRLSAIAHLKAAVAATVADRFSKGNQTPKEPDATRLVPYRDDLARVVRPQTPAGSDDAPATPRPAPLVLVSAQRIDRPRTSPGESTTPLASVPNAPVRPRRVTSAQVAVEPGLESDDEEEEIDATNIFTDARGFAEFSERLGANSLAEILEAAAAYTVCIQGRPHFSRPLLMGQIGALSADSEFTREDGLRTFGALLREGRIQKIKRGQFVLTERSHYLAEARKIAG